MRKLIVLASLVAGLAFAQTPKIEPAFADRLFPYVTYKTTWSGTPAMSEDVTVPNTLIVYGRNEDPEVVAAAAKIAYYIGQWTEDIGFGVEDVRQSTIPDILVSDSKLANTKHTNLIVVGVNNDLVRSSGIQFDGPTIRVIQRDNKQIMFVGGRTKEEVIKAANYLADVRLNFKVGAYRTYFNFVALRGMLEAGEFDSALRLIKSPNAISSCGKNMALFAPILAQWEDEIKAVVRRRNLIIYSELPKAIDEGNKEKAVELWKAAMYTCYQCHQGIEIPQMRKFKPLASIHEKHQRIAQSYGLVRVVGDQKLCMACHAGPTYIRGYQTVGR